jgi:MFS family permease
VPFLPGIILIGIPLILLGHIAHLWQYDLLCVLIVIGYTLAGPISNQVLVAQWFRRRRGRAMGYAYLGLGLGGVVAPWSANDLIRAFGWRHALEITGAVTLLVLLPVGVWITRSTPAEMGLLPDGASSPASLPPVACVQTLTAMRTGNFWLLLLGCTLVMGSLNTVIQHIIFFLMDQGYTRTAASHLLSALLVASLAGRVAVGHIADRFRKKNTMAVFYLILGGSIPLLYLSHNPAAATLFAAIFGFTMGADYMLIPLVTAECFGIGALGKLLAIVIMGYSLGQGIALWLAGVIFDQYHSYNLAWAIMAVSGILGAAAIALIKQPSTSPQQNC